MQSDSFYNNTITPTQGRGARLLPDWLEDGRDTVDGVGRELRPPSEVGQHTRVQKQGIMGNPAAQNRDNTSVQMLDRNYTNASEDYDF